jgi:hypothetical protein
VRQGDVGFEVATELPIAHFAFAESPVFPRLDAGRIDVPSGRVRKIGHAARDTPLLLEQVGQHLCAMIDQTDIVFRQAAPTDGTEAKQIPRRHDPAQFRQDRGLERSRRGPSHSGMRHHRCHDEAAA